MSLFTAIQGSSKPAGGGAGSATIYALASDGYIESSDDEEGYAVARNGTASKNADTGGAGLQIGQNPEFGIYTVWESFLNFDVSEVLGPAATAELSLWVQTDESDQDFTIEVRANDWGDTLETTDWVAGGDLAAKTLLASLTTVGLSTGAYSLIAETGTALRDAIDTAVAGDGMLRLIICSSRTTDNNAPSVNEFVTAASSDTADTTSDPKLEVTW